MSHRQKWLFGALIIINLTTWSLVGYRALLSGKLAPGTTFHGLALGGDTRGQVTVKVQNLTDSLLDQPAKLVINHVAYTPTYRNLGFTIDDAAIVDQLFARNQANQLLRYVAAKVTGQAAGPGNDLSFTLDTATTNRYLKTIQSKLPTTAKDASIVFDGQLVTIAPAVRAITIDIPTATQLIATKLSVTTPIASLAIPVTITDPKIDSDSQLADARRFATAVTNKPLAIQVGSDTTTWSPAMLFSFIDFSTPNDRIETKLNSNKIAAEVKKIAAKVAISAVPKQVKAADNSVIIEGRDGQALNTGTATSAIMGQLNQGNLNPITLATSVVPRSTITVTPDYQLGRLGDKYIEIDLSSQMLYLINGDHLDHQFRISSGKASTPTPTGEFTIHDHLPVAWSSLYGVYMDHWMGFLPDNADVYGIHALPHWPNGVFEGINHLGEKVSGGCVRLSLADAATTYDWTPNGTKVFIHQ